MDQLRVCSSSGVQYIVDKNAIFLTCIDCQLHYMLHDVSFCLKESVLCCLYVDFFCVALDAGWFFLEERHFTTYCVYCWNDNTSYLT